MNDLDETPEWVKAVARIDARDQAADTASDIKKLEFRKLYLARSKLIAENLPQSEVEAATATPFDALVRKKLIAERRPKSTKVMTPAELREFRKLRGLDEEAMKRARLQIECMRSLAVFTQTFWHVVEEGTPLVWNWHIDVMCDELQKVYEGETTRLLINIPPGNMKSMLVNVMFSAWIWFRNPTWRSIHATYDQALLIRDSDKLRKLLKSDFYQSMLPKLYGDNWNRRWEMSKEQDAKKQFATEYGGSRFSTTIRGAGTGHRGDCVVIDDPMNAEESPTDEALQSIVDWYDGRMSTRFNDMMSGRIILIMQRLHEYDLAGHIIASDEREKNNPNWVPFKKIILPAEYNPSKAKERGWDAYDIRTKRGELLFPEKFPQPVIDVLKIKLGDKAQAQLDQDPIAAGGGIFDVSKLRFWYPRSMIGNAPPPHMLEDREGNQVSCYQAPYPDRVGTFSQSWDCAFKDHKDNDYVAGQLWMRHGANAYLVAQEYGHFSFTKTLERIRALTRVEPRAIAKYVEDKANGSAVIDTLKATMIGLIEVDPKGGKEARMIASSPLVLAGNIWLPHPFVFPWVKLLIKEMSAAPRGKNDDQIDAMTQFLLAEMVIEGRGYLQKINKL